MEPRSPALQADSLLSEPSGKPTFMGYLLLYANHFMRPENREESDLSPKNYGTLNQMLCQSIVKSLISSSMCVCVFYYMLVKTANDMEACK